jgi:hypothetical protein
MIKVHANNCRVLKEGNYKILVRSEEIEALKPEPGKYVHVATIEDITRIEFRDGTKINMHDEQTITTTRNVSLDLQYKELSADADITVFGWKLFRAHVYIRFPEHIGVTLFTGNKAIAYAAIDWYEEKEENDEYIDEEAEVENAKETEFEEEEEVV